MKNWKTTIIGAAFGSAIVVMEMIKDGERDYVKILIGFTVAFIGAVAADYDKIPK